MIFTFSVRLFLFTLCNVVLYSILLYYVMFFHVYVCLIIDTTKEYYVIFCSIFLCDLKIKIKFTDEAIIQDILYFIILFYF